MQNKKQRFIRLIALCLLIATIGTLVLTACGGDDDDSKVTTAKTSGGDTPAGDNITQQIREKYADTNLGGTFKILGMASGTWWYSGFMSDTFNEIWYETSSAEPLENAIYTRNCYTEDLLGITIEPIFVDDENENDSPADRLRTALETGDTDFDLVLSSMAECLLLAQEGHCANVMDIDAIDLSNQWWDQSLVECFTLFHDRMYVLSGYYNVYDDMSVNMMMFNKELIESLKLDSPYDLVHQNRWTIDNLAAMAKAATQPSPYGTMDDDASWGLWVGSGGGLLFGGFNKPATVQNEEGVPEIVMGKEDYVDAASKLYESVYQADICYNPSAGTEMRDAIFADNRLLFYWIITCQLNRYRNMDTEFGIVPMAKLNSEQTRYSGGVNQHFYSAMVIPRFAPDPERTGTIMEVMSGLSADTVYQTTFDTMLGYDSKLLRDNDSKEMLDIVFASKQYSFNLMGLGELGQVLEGMSSWGSFMYESAYDTYKRGANAALKRIINNFESIE